MAETSSAGSALDKCPWCGSIHEARCPDVKAIEYYSDGTVKRVEFKTAADYHWPSNVGDWVVGGEWPARPVEKQFG